MISYLAISICAVPLLLWLYSKYVAQKPRVFVKFGSTLHSRVQKHIPLIQDVYQPAWWCPVGTVMTVVRQLFRSCPNLPFKRELVDLPDTGVLAIDWLIPEDTTDESHIVLFLPGITGTTHECAYVLHAAMEAADHGWRSVVLNQRALGGVEVKTKRLYNAASHGDLGHVLQLITDRYPKARKIACGYSLGGIILGNYLHSRSIDNVNLDGAMIISSVFDPHASSVSLEAPLPRILFNQFLAKCLIEIVKPHRHIFEDVVDFEHVLASRTIREFDTRFTSPVHGYKDCKEYYEDATMRPKMTKIPVPTVILNAIDDVFAPVESLPLTDISQSETVVAIVTSHGGHTAYMEGTNPNSRGYVERLLAQWGDMVLNEKF